MRLPKPMPASPNAVARFRPFRALALALAAAMLAACTPLSPPAPERAPVQTRSPAPDLAGEARARRQAPEASSGRTTKTIRFAARDMVAAANPLAVQAGVRVLAEGGSAVDAAIAAQMVLNLVEPQSSGIGGGAFMLHYDGAHDTLRTYDGRETAPAAATADMFVDAEGRELRFLFAVDSGLSVGTPGLLRMLEMAHRRHGRLPWSRLFDDAIRLAESGFEISPRLAALIARTAARFDAQGDPVRGYFLNPDGTPKRAGTRLTNPEFAATLRTVAAGGADAFYTGPIAQAIVDKVRAHPTAPGRLTTSDLAGYRAKERAPLCGGYRGHKVCGMGPPSTGGIAVLQTLGILEGFPLASLPPDSVDAVHLVAEAYRLAYADRARYVADGDFVSVPVAGLLDPAYLRERARLIRMDRSMGVPRAGNPAGAPPRAGEDASMPLPSTSHLSIVDRFGDAVSMTTSIENAFGSLQMVGGFLLNNHMTDFSFRAADARGNPTINRIEPGKRPRSSMSPTIVFDAGNRVEAVLGSPGGTNIIAYVTKTLVGLLDWGLNVQQAIDLPNFVAQTSATTVLERSTPIVAAQPGLEARGHTVVLSDLNSGVHAIVFEHAPRGDGPAGTQAHGAGRWAGGADPRREGTAAGND